MKDIEIQEMQYRARATALQQTADHAIYIAHRLPIETALQGKMLSQQSFAESSTCGEVDCRPEPNGLTRVGFQGRADHSHHGGLAIAPNAVFQDSGQLAIPEPHRTISAAAPKHENAVGSVARHAQDLTECMP